MYQCKKEGEQDDALNGYQEIHEDPTNGRWMVVLALQLQSCGESALSRVDPFAPDNSHVSLRAAAIVAATREPASLVMSAARPA